MIRDKGQEVKQDEENETIGVGAVAKRVFRQELWGGLGEVWARQKEQHMQMPRGRTDLPVTLPRAPSLDKAMWPEVRSEEEEGPDHVRGLEGHLFLLAQMLLSPFFFFS